MTFIDTAGWSNLAAAMSTTEASGAVPRTRNLRPSVGRLTDAIRGMAEVDDRPFAGDRIEALRPGSVNAGT